MDERVGLKGIPLTWKVVIAFVELGLASLTLFSIPASPDFSVLFASATLNHHMMNHSTSSPSKRDLDLDLDLGFSVTNLAIDRMVYNQIIISAFHGQDCLATATLTPFEQRGGEITFVWFRFKNVTLPPAVLDNMPTFVNVSYVTIELRAKARYGRKQEIPMQVVCEDVEVVLVSSSNVTWDPTLRFYERKCKIDGIWRHREQWLFVALFVVPVSLFILALCCQTFIFRRNCDDSILYMPR